MTWYALLCACAPGLVGASSSGGSRSAAPEYVEVETEAGSLRGVREKVLGRDLDIFLGIPFALPPTGVRRFQRPEHLNPWSGVRDATRRPASCYQAVDHSFDDFVGVRTWNPNTNMSEDCLYLNVWAPSERTYGRKPGRTVMVWIYGGGFYGGTSTLDLYDGRILAAANDVIVVSMQYRVGTLGFMFLGPNGGAPGNMGLVDQQLALRWIYNNIDSFGGDNNAVTLFGESAGAVSVSMHLLSPLSRPLFQYAIMQSGSANCVWATETPLLARQRTLNLAAKVNCPTEGVTDAELIGCLQRVDPEVITTQMWTLLDRHNLVTPILVTIDGYFLREDPMVSVAKGDFKQTSVLLGAMKDEGSYFLVYSIPSLFRIKSNTSLPHDKYMKIVRSISRSDRPIVAKAIDFEYNVPRNVTIKSRMYRDLMDDIVGDSEFICPVVKFGEAYEQAGNRVYMYQFTHRSSGNPWPAWMGVMHGYEIDHVFGVPLNDTYSYSTEEKQLSKRIMTYWSNFAKTGWV